MVNLKRTVIAACAVAWVLAACGGGTPRAGRGTAEGILHVGNGAEPQSLDPHLVTGVTEHRLLGMLFEGLVNLDPRTLDPIPGVAQSWDISPDGLEYTFRLRDNARWSSGDPVTAADFVYSWRRILTPSLAAEYAYMLHCIRNAQAYHEGRLTDFGQVGVRALDDHTLEVTLEHPTPSFLARQQHTTYLPVHQATVERFGPMDERESLWTRAGNLVGNGPFRLVTWSPGEVIEVTRNEHYWDAAAVKLNGIRAYPIDDLQTEERSFRAGELHVTSDIPIGRIPVYRRDNPAVLNITPYLGTYFYRLNVTRPPFTDARVRRAFALAVDREALVTRVTMGGERPATGLVPPGTAGYTGTHALPYDPAEARRLLAEAGFPEGQGLPPVDLLYNTSENHKIIAEAVARMWKENLGAEVRLLNQDWKTYLSSMTNLDYQIARSGWIGDVPDPANFLECFLAGGGNNRTGWSSPGYDRLLAEAEATADPTARNALLDQAEGILLDDAPIVPIYVYTWRFLRAPEVKGWEPNPLGYVLWKGLRLEPAAP